MNVFSAYNKQNNFLAKIDARVKILMSLALIVMIISYSKAAFPLLIACIALIICRWIKIPAKTLLLRLSEPLFIAFILVMLRFMFTGNNIVFSVEIIGIKIAGHSDGLMDGLTIASRIFGAASVITVLSFTTSFTEIVAGLSWFRIPKGFIDIFIYAHRYIFVLFEDAIVIYNAQKNRLGYANVKRSLHSFGTLAGTLLIKAFDQSQNTTIAMVQRGFDGNIPMLKHKPFKFSEILVSILLITSGVLVWKI